jgi:uncharacterized protein YaaN involved in tellurite resistance
MADYASSGPGGQGAKASAAGKVDIEALEKAAEQVVEGNEGVNGH